MKTSIEVIVEVEIERPLSEVWSFLTDTERIPEWVGEFVSAHEESDGPPGLGTIVRYTLEPGNRSCTWEIVEWDPPGRVAWDGPPLRWGRGGVRPRGSHELIEVGDSVVVFMRESGRARHGGPDVQSDTAMVIRLRQQKIAEMTGYLDREEALRAARLRPSQP